jgi:TolA protein
LNSHFDLRANPDFLRERWPMITALLFSLLIHALLLSLVFGRERSGLPDLGLPWREKRFEADNLYVVLAPAQVAAPVMIKPSVDILPTGIAKPNPIAAPNAIAVMAPLPTGGSGKVASPPIPAPASTGLERSDTVSLAVSVASLVPVPVIPAATTAAIPPRDTSVLRNMGEAAPKQIDPEARLPASELAQRNPSKQQSQRQIEPVEPAQQAVVSKEAPRLEVEGQEDARQMAVLQEALRVETARLQAERQDAARQEAARQALAQQEAARAEAERLEDARQAAVRQEAQRVETARLQAERQDAARQEAAMQALAQQEAARAEAERLEDARQAAVRQEAQRVETARLQAERQAAARQEAENQQGARQKAERAEYEARREVLLRAIGRQLDDEAAKRNAASTLLESSSRARRGRLFGRTDPDTELVLYAEAWSRKIELNMTFDMVREPAKQRHTDPLVTVALRSDGSVESVTFVTSSGVAEIDEAIRRIVQSQAPYPAFPPGLAREYDVVEIRRSWHFDMAVRLF